MTPSRWPLRLRSLSPIWQAHHGPWQVPLRCRLVPPSTPRHLFGPSALPTVTGEAAPGPPPPNEVLVDAASA